VAEACGEGGGLEERCAALNRTIHARYGYEGDSATYDDLQNANLIRVIDRRKGLPIALGILYIHAARSHGWDIVGLSFPGHFLLRLDCAGERAILDPFHRGKIRDAGEMPAIVLERGLRQVERGERERRLGEVDAVVRPGADAAQNFLRVVR
jgi:regulator of sirC expression with transglutaminase-like and TPR domain